MSCAEDLFAYALLVKLLCSDIELLIYLCCMCGPFLIVYFLFVFIEGVDIAGALFVERGVVCWSWLAGVVFIIYNAVVAFMFVLTCCAVS